MELKSMMFICNDYPPWSQGGGIASFTKSLAERMDKRNINTFIAGCGVGVSRLTEQRIGNITTRQIPYWKIKRCHPWLNRLRLNFCILESSYRHRIQILETPEYLGWLWPWKPRVPVVVRFNSSSRLQIWKEISDGSRVMPRWAKFELQTIRRGDTYCAVSEYLKKQIQCVIPGMDNKTIDVIPNNVDTSFFFPGPKTEVDPKSAVFLGRISVPKGVPELMEAWKSVLGIIPDAKLKLLGRDSVGEDGNGSFIDELKVSFSPQMMKSVQFIGDVNQDQVRSYIRQAAFCVFASHYEACSNAVIEAMSCGKAVIVPNNTSFPEMVKNEFNGLIWESSDITTLSSAIVRLYDEHNLRDQLGKHARQTAIARFDVDYLFEQNMNLYRRSLQTVKNGFER